MLTTSDLTPDKNFQVGPGEANLCRAHRSRIGHLLNYPINGLSHDGATQVPNAHFLGWASTWHGWQFPAPPVGSSAWQSSLKGLSHGAVSRGIRYGQPAEQRLVLNHSDLLFWFTLSISLPISLRVSFLITLMVPFRVTLMMVPLALIMVALVLIVVALVLIGIPLALLVISLVLMVIPITFLMVPIVLLIICIFMGATVAFLMVSNVKVRVGFFFFLFFILSLTSVCSRIEFFSPSPQTP